MSSIPLDRNIPDVIEGFAGQEADGPPVADHLSWKTEVVADASGNWFGNAMRYATRGEAVRETHGLYCRWTLVTKWRVSPSADPVYPKPEGGV